MKELVAIINSMSGEEKMAFYAFAKAKNKRSDVKNIKLFQLLDKGVTTGLAKRLYGEENQNALYALTKRLRDSLIDFTAAHGLETESDAEMEILKKLLASRIFFEKGLYKLSFKTLKKAQNVAQELELYALLNEIYHTLLQYAHKDDHIDLPQLITEYEKNLKNHLGEAHLMTAYASIKSDLQKSQNDVELFIEKHLNKYEIKLDASFGYKSLFTLMNIAAEAAGIKTDYYSALHFMDAAYHIVNYKKELASRHLYYHIAILNLMSMTYFRNKDFEKAQEFLDLMHIEMQRENGKYRSVFIESYEKLSGLVEIYTGLLPQAIERLESVTKPSPETALALIMAHFQNNNFVACTKIMNSLSHSDDYYEKRAGFNWVIKRNIIELLILIERNQPDLVESRMRRFNKKYRKRLLDKKEHRVLTYIKLLRKYYDAPHDVTTSTFSNTVEKSFDWIGTEREDIFVMTFYAWLKAKIQSRPLYEVTLELKPL